MNFASSGNFCLRLFYLMAIASCFGVACVPQERLLGTTQPNQIIWDEGPNMDNSTASTFEMKDSTPSIQIQTEVVDYEVSGVTMKGYLAFDDTRTEKRPGILVVHEWWGHNEYARKRTRMLAELGYTAFAVDMYGEGKLAKHPDQAMQFMKETQARSDLSRSRFQAALELLKSHPTVDPEKTAAIGYCFGGGVVIDMVRQGLDLDGIVMFHGGVAPAKIAAKPGTVKTKVLVCHGDDDQLVSLDALQAFQEEMKTSEIEMQFIRYVGAKHSFTNPDADALGAKFGLPVAYSPQADRESWSDMLNFFHRLFT